MQVLSVGEVLWDVFPAVEHLGGAPLNFTANLIRLGHSAALITAVGDDSRGSRAVEEMVKLGIDVSGVERREGKPTGIAIVGTTSDGEPAYDFPRPTAFDFIGIQDAALQRFKALRPQWLYFGTLAQMEPRIETVVACLRSELSSTRCFYDINLRPGCWNLALVQRLARAADVLKLNEAEAEVLWNLTSLDRGRFSLERFCEQWTGLFALDCICVTLGSEGCFFYRQDEVQIVPGYPAVVRDTVGAGDAFAAGFLHGLHRGWSLERIGRFANALGSIVASRPGATPVWTLEECSILAATSPQMRQRPHDDLTWETA